MLRAVGILIAMFTGAFMTCLAMDAGTNVDSNLNPSTRPPHVRRLEAPGIHNLFAVTPNVYSGSTPEGAEAFAALRALGVKTILSVDGARPDLETAREHGLRYVHLPCGYDGIQAETQLQIVKAAVTFPGPLFVHCHHGNHRGPAAAAILGREQGGWTAAQAEAWMRTAGTGTNYPGLYECVRRFVAPSADRIRQVSTNLPEQAPVRGLVEAMVELDRRWDRLKMARQHDYRPSPQHPELLPARDLALLREHYREVQRLPEAEARGTNFLEQLRTAEAGTQNAEESLRQFNSTPTSQLHAQLNRAFDRLQRSCVTCHQSHRDHAGPAVQP